MRLTLINQFYPPDISPTAHLCASLAKHRAARGDHVTVLTSRSGYVSAVDRRTFDHGVNVRRIWSTRLGSRSRLTRLIDWGTFYFSTLICALVLPRQDVIIAMTTPPYIALAAILHKLLHPSTRIVLWNMDCYPEAIERTGMVKTGGLISCIMRAMNRAIFRRLDHLIVLDGAMDQLLEQYKPRDRQLASTVIANWEDASQFELEGPKEKWTEPTAAALRGKFVLLYLGNAGYGHEFQTLIDAAKQLRDDPVAFLFVGGGAKREWIRSECRANALNNIILEDYVPRERVAEVMRTADAALITLENQMAGVMSPSKLHACLAMGLPILYVGPPHSNVDEAIARFCCGASVRPGHVDEFVRVIREWASGMEEVQRLAKNAKSAFREAYCDGKVLPKFDAILG
ncbi:MAG TPA: glycosyltransferase family 4 protein [Humisphaera sp.]|jgi:glycosyltransferase involved in cell wall biosynthesis|nr:glycosyltransferase family 4 protein [Humisphaera sp.]